jgi:hypothetical protein
MNIEFVIPEGVGETFMYTCVPCFVKNAPDEYFTRSILGPKDPLRVCLDGGIVGAIITQDGEQLTPKKLWVDIKAPEYNTLPSTVRCSMCDPQDSPPGSQAYFCHTCCANFTDMIAAMIIGFSKKTPFFCILHRHAENKPADVHNELVSFHTDTAYVSECDITNELTRTSNIAALMKARAIRMDARKKAMDVRKKAMDVRKKAMDAREQAMDAREQAMDAREKAIDDEKHDRMHFKEIRDKEKMTMQALPAAKTARGRRAD